MKLTIEVEVPDTVAASEHMTGLQRHVTNSADLAVKEFINNEVNPKGCWCTGLSHLETCRHWLLPY